MDNIEIVKEVFGDDVNIPKLIMVFPTIENVFRTIYESDNEKPIQEIHAVIEGAKTISGMEFNRYTNNFKNDPEAQNLNILYQFWINNTTKNVEAQMLKEMNSKENNDVTHVEALLILEHLVKASTTIERVKTTTLVKLLYYLRKKHPTSKFEYTTEYSQYNAMRAQSDNSSIEAHKTYSKKAALFLRSINLDEVADQIYIDPEKK